MLHLINRTLLRMDQRSQLRKQYLSDRDEIPLSLQHSSELRQIRFQPILLLVTFRGTAQVVDHRVDVVFELCHFATGFDLNRTRQIALGHSRGDLRDGADLVSQIRGK